VTALTEGRGVGLSNTRERMRVLYAERHRFAALNSHPGLRLDLALPLERAPRELAREQVRA
jgi:hypothetical protein